MVWNFQYEPPYFKDDELNLAYLFPVFANVYHVKVTTFAKQRFLKCDCLHYERCGIPCSHILKITNEIEEMIIKHQHLKVYQVHYGNTDWNLSSKLMQGSSLQTSYEDMGMPLLDKCLDKALIPRESLWVTLSGICTFTSFEFVVQFENINSLYQLAQSQSGYEWIYTRW